MYYKYATKVRSIDFGRVLLQERSAETTYPALAPSCKKQVTGFFVHLSFFLKVKHVSYRHTVTLEVPMAIQNSFYKFTLKILVQVLKLFFI